LAAVVLLAVEQTRLRTTLALEGCRPLWDSLLMAAVLLALRAMTERQALLAVVVVVVHLSCRLWVVLALRGKGTMVVMVEELGLAANEPVVVVVAGRRWGRTVPWGRAGTVATGFRRT